MVPVFRERNAFNPVVAYNDGPGGAESAAGVVNDRKKTGEKTKRKKIALEKGGF